MKSNHKWGLASFILIILSGALVFSAGGHTWGTEDAAVVVGVTMFLAFVVSGMITGVLSDGIPK